MKRTNKTRYEIVTCASELSEGDKIRLWSRKFNRFYDCTVKMIVEVEDYSEIIINKSRNGYFAMGVPSLWVDIVWRVIE